MAGYCSSTRHGMCVGRGSKWRTPRPRPPGTAAQRSEVPNSGVALGLSPRGLFHLPPPSARRGWGYRPRREARSAKRVFKTPSQVARLVTCRSSRRGSSSPFAFPLQGLSCGPRVNPRTAHAAAPPPSSSPPPPSCRTAPSFGWRDRPSSGPWRWWHPGRAGEAGSGQDSAALLGLLRRSWPVGASRVHGHWIPGLVARRRAVHRAQWRSLDASSAGRGRPVVSNRWRT